MPVSSIEWHGICYRFIAFCYIEDSTMDWIKGIGMLHSVMFTAFLGLAATTLGACASEGRFEQTGQEIDEAVDEAEDVFE